MQENKPFWFGYLGSFLRHEKNCLFSDLSCFVMSFRFFSNFSHSRLLKVMMITAPTQSSSKGKMLSKKMCSNWAVKRWCYMFTYASSHLANTFLFTKLVLLLLLASSVLVRRDTRNSISPLQIQTLPAAQASNSPPKSVFAFGRTFWLWRNGLISLALASNLDNRIIKITRQHQS